MVRHPVHGKLETAQKAAKGAAKRAATCDGTTQDAHAFYR